MRHQSSCATETTVAPCFLPRNCSRVLHAAAAWGASLGHCEPPGAVEACVWRRRCPIIRFEIPVATIQAGSHLPPLSPGGFALIGKPEGLRVASAGPRAYSSYRRKGYLCSGLVRARLCNTSRGRHSRVPLVSASFRFKLKGERSLHSSRYRKSRTWCYACKDGGIVIGIIPPLVFDRG